MTKDEIVYLQMRVACSQVELGGGAIDAARRELIGSGDSGVREFQQELESLCSQLSLFQARMREYRHAAGDRMVAART
jgi:hypothetical protein